MNAKQGGLSPTGNVDFGVTNVGAALEIFSMSASDDSTTFAKLVETNASLIRQLNESLGKNSSPLVINKKLAGSAPPTKSAYETGWKVKNW